MDRPRVQHSRSQRYRPWAIAIGLLLAGLVAIFGFRDGAEAIERSDIQIEVVTRGPLVREISAPGVLAPANMTVISAPVSGRVEERLAEIGDLVRAGAPIVELSNRDERRDLLEIEQQRAAAESDLADLRATMRAEELSSANAMRQAQFEARDATRQATASEKLYAEGLLSKLQADRDADAATELTQRAESEEERHAALRESASARLASQINRIDRLKALEAFQRDAVGSMIVKTPVEGVVREIEVDSGVWVNIGQRLARIVEPGRLDAILQVAEAAAREVTPGQIVRLNARGTLLDGAVERAAPAVTGGTVSVEVRLDGELPPGLRPDLSVEGAIVIARLDDVLSISRPSTGNAHSPGTLYRLTAEGRLARTELLFGVASSDRIEIRDGASEGDRFVISGLENETRQTLQME